MGGSFRVVFPTQYMNSRILWRSSLIIFTYLRSIVHYVFYYGAVPVRHKICVLYVEKSTSYLELKCANTLENRITRVLDFVPVFTYGDLDLLYSTHHGPSLDTSAGE